MKKTKPNYNAMSSNGGYLVDVPLPHLRMFPGERRREVQLTILRYWGIGVHYYATLKEEDNPLWCTHRDRYTKEDHWHKPWDDTAAGNGQDFHDRFNTHEAAKDWVKKIIAEHFPQATHVVLKATGNEEASKWFYGEGD